MRMTAAGVHPATELKEIIVVKRKIWILMLTVCLLAAGCGYAEAKDTLFEERMAFIQAHADELRTSLEQDALTQLDMNEKALELRILWDVALGYAMYEVMSARPEEATALLAEQQEWLAERDEAVKAAAKDAEGGSMYPLFVNMEAAQMAEERMNELHEMLK